MEIKEIYKQYVIIPSLQMHMLRVAGVAMVICQACNEPVDTHEIISACLLHDMGNILKFNFSVLPEFFQPEGVEYWQGIQEQFRTKYGENEHTATLTIAREIGATARVMELLEAIGFSQARYNFEHHDFSRKIAMYSDMRVTPHGVTSLQERLAEGHKRFLKNKHTALNEPLFQEGQKYLGKIEEQLFAACSISPESVNDDVVLHRIEGLRHHIV